MAARTLHLVLSAKYFDMLDEGRRTEVRRCSSQQARYHLKHKRSYGAICLHRGYVTDPTRTYELIDIEAVRASDYNHSFANGHNVQQVVTEMGDMPECDGKVIVYHFL